MNNVNFGNCISAIYQSELELKDTSTSSTEVCYGHKYQDWRRNHTFPYQQLR